MVRTLSLAVTITALAASITHAADLSGRVQVAGKPVTGATVTLYAAGTGVPTRLAQGRTDGKGAFELEASEASGKSVLYLLAKGGTPQATANKGANDDLSLLILLGATPPRTAMVNELTTVASAFTAARFIRGEAIAGHPLGLQIAAANVPNLVDPATGGWGKVILDPINITQSTALANLNTLASLIAAYATVSDDAWRGRFLKAATPTSGAMPKNTLEAMAGIASEPWNNAKELFALFDEAYPRPKDGARRAAPFQPYLGFAPPDFALSLCFAGGGVCAPGKFLFDANGNLWSGQNWMPGAQNTVLNAIGGGVVKFTPNGSALSPVVTGFTGMGIDGIGWGTGVDPEKVWATSFNGKILVMDFDGRPIGKESDFPMAGKVGGLQAVATAANGDVWIADATKNQLLHFPGGRVEEGRLVHVEGLKSPFGIAIDNQNRVWVSNAQSDTVVRFSANDPSKVESFRCGIGVRGVALDSKGNLWVASNMSLDFPPPKIPEGVSIMNRRPMSRSGKAATWPCSRPGGIGNVEQP